MGVTVQPVRLAGLGPSGEPFAGAEMRRASRRPRLPHEDRVPWPFAISKDTARTARTPISCRAIAILERREPHANAALERAAQPAGGGSAWTAVHSQRARLIGSRNMPPMRTPICQRTWAWTGPTPGTSSDT